MSLHRLYKSLVDLLLPRTCAGCGSRLALDEHYVCAQCLLNMPTETNHNWRYNPFVAKWSEHEALHQAGAFTRYEKDGTSAHIIHSLKYYRHSELGDWMGRLAAQQLRSTGLFDGAYALVPLPLTPRRQRYRGFNQAEIIARGMAAELQLPVLTTLLRRIVDRESQTHFTHAQRKLNVRGIFTLADHELARSLEGRSIILVDDVMTTGATMLSAIEALEGIPHIKLTAFAWAWVHSNHVLRPS